MVSGCPFRQSSGSGKQVNVYTISISCGTRLSFILFSTDQIGCRYRSAAGQQTDLQMPIGFRKFSLCLAGYHQRLAAKRACCNSSLSFRPGGLWEGSWKYLLRFNFNSPRPVEDNPVAQKNFPVAGKITVDIKKWFAITMRSPGFY